MMMMIADVDGASSPHLSADVAAVFPCPFLPRKAGATELVVPTRTACCTARTVCDSWHAVAHHLLCLKRPQGSCIMRGTDMQDPYGYHGFDGRRVSSAHVKERVAMPLGLL
jgi:hypothetical protein